MNSIKSRTVLLYLSLAFMLLHTEFYICYGQSPGSSGWIRKSDAPQGFVFPHMTPQILNNKLYFMQTKDYTVNNLLIFDFKNDSWITKPTSLLSNGHHFATAVYDNKLYAAGGCLGENDSVVHVRTGSMQMYDPKTDTWTPRKSMITPRAGFHLVPFENKIYAIGGFDKDSIPIRTIEVYDPETDTWSVKTTGPWEKSLICFGSVVFNKKIYIIGETNRVSVFMLYDPHKNTFNSLTPMYLDRYAYGVTLAGDVIIVFGGAREKPIKTAAGYNITKNKWTEYPELPEPTAYPGIIHFDNKVYCVGGVGSTWNWGNPNNSVYVLDLESGAVHTTEN